MLQILWRITERNMGAISSIRDSKFRVYWKKFRVLTWFGWCSKLKNWFLKNVLWFHWVKIFSISWRDYFFATVTSSFKNMNMIIKKFSQPILTKFGQPLLTKLCLVSRMATILEGFIYPHIKLFPYLSNIFVQWISQLWNFIEWVIYRSRLIWSI